jgi:hypothetical protein
VVRPEPMPLQPSTCMYYAAHAAERSWRRAPPPPRPPRASNSWLTMAPPTHNDICFHMLAGVLLVGLARAGVRGLTPTS